MREGVGEGEENDGGGSGNGRVRRERALDEVMQDKGGAGLNRVFNGDKSAGERPNGIIQKIRRRSTTTMLHSLSLSLSLPFFVQSVVGFTLQLGFTD